MSCCLVNTVPGLSTGTVRSPHQSLRGSFTTKLSGFTQRGWDSSAESTLTSPTPPTPLGPAHCTPDHVSGPAGPTLRVYLPLSRSAMWCRPLAPTQSPVDEFATLPCPRRRVLLLRCPRLGHLSWPGLSHSICQGRKSRDFRRSSSRRIGFDISAVWHVTRIRWSFVYDLASHDSGIDIAWLGGWCWVFRYRQSVWRHRRRCPSPIALRSCSSCRCRRLLFRRQSSSKQILACWFSSPQLIGSGFLSLRQILRPRLAFVARGPFWCGQPRLTTLWSWINRTAVFTTSLHVGTTNTRMWILHLVCRFTTHNSWSGWGRRRLHTSSAANPASGSRSCPAWCKSHVL